jgi:FMN-binding domain
MSAGWDRWAWLPAVVVPAAIAPIQAYAATYFTTAQAQQAIFPGGRFTKAFVTLTPAQAAAIEKASGDTVLNREVHAWRVSGGGWFILDEVVGKHDFITYAVGIDPKGAIKGIEIVEYREAYGYQVHNAAWREQFVGKTATDLPDIQHNIRNISGATLSCVHLTKGVRRVLETYALALKG